MRPPTPPPPPLRRRPAGGTAALLAAIASLLAAGLSAAGLFGRVNNFSNTFGDDGETVDTERTWWGVTTTGDPYELSQDTSTLAGLVLVAAAVVFVLAAVFAFLSGRSGRPGVRSAARSLASGGLGLLTGITALVLIDNLAQVSRLNDAELDAGQSIEFTIGIGLWLPLAGVVLGVVAVVLAHRGLRPMRREPATPPMGFRMQQHGPGPMTGPQPAVPGPGQSSGRFAPVPAPDRGVGQGSGQFAPVAPPADRGAGQGSGQFAPADRGAGQGSGQFAPVTPPADHAAGQDSGRFAPVTPPATPDSPTPSAPEPPTVASGPEPDPEGERQSLASRLDSADSTSDTPEEPDPDVTQRTTVHTGPPATTGVPPHLAGATAQPSAPPATSAPNAPAEAAPAQPARTDAPSTSDSEPAGSKAPLDLPPAPPAPELADDKDRTD